MARGELDAESDSDDWSTQTAYADAPIFMLSLPDSSTENTLFTAHELLDPTISTPAAATPACVKSPTICGTSSTPCSPDERSLSRSTKPPAQTPTSAPRHIVERSRVRRCRRRGAVIDPHNSQEAGNDGRTEELATVEDGVSGEGMDGGFLAVEGQVGEMVANGETSQIGSLVPPVEGTVKWAKKLSDVCMKLAEEVVASISFLSSDGEEVNNVEDAVCVSSSMSTGEAEVNTVVLVEGPETNVTQVGSLVPSAHHCEERLKPQPVESQIQEQRVESPLSQERKAASDYSCSGPRIPSNQECLGTRRTNPVVALMPFALMASSPLKYGVQDESKEEQSVPLSPRNGRNCSEVPLGTCLLNDILKILANLDAEVLKSPLSVEEQRETSLIQLCVGPTLPSDQGCSGAKRAHPTESSVPLREWVPLPLCNASMDGSKQALAGSLASNQVCCSEVSDGVCGLESIPQELVNANAEIWKPAMVESSMQGQNLEAGIQVCDGPNGPSNQECRGIKRACQAESMIPSEEGQPSPSKHGAKYVTNQVEIGSLAPPHQGSCSKRPYKASFLEGIVNGLHDADAENPKYDLFNIAQSTGLVIPRLSWW